MTNARRSSALLFTAIVSVAACGPGGGGEGAGAQTPAGGGSGEKHELLDNPAPAFSAETVNGKGTVSVDPSGGKVTLVDFWATWCEPCKKSFPKLEELRVKYEASGFQIIAVSEDDEDTGIKQFGETHGAKFPLVWDKDKSIAGKYKPPNMPSSFIIDKKGIVRHVHLGYHDGEEKQIEQEVKSLL